MAYKSNGTDSKIEKKQAKKPKLGLALGAGSARGFAHIGVLQVFEKHNIPIDLIVGSSMGSVIGGVYACGADLSMLSRVIPLLNERDFFDVVMPRHGGILRGDKFKELIKLFTKGMEFSQTHIPFACVATDLNNGELVVMNEGSIDDAIRASIAIPGIFEPYKWNDRLLVDGSLISRVPSDIARDLGADIVIGVDVGYRGGPIDMKPITMIDYLLTSTDIMSWQYAKIVENSANVMIIPKVRGLDPNSFKDAEECITAGWDAACERIDEIIELLGYTPQSPSEKVSLKRA